MQRYICTYEYHPKKNYYFIRDAYAHDMWERTLNGRCVPACVRVCVLENNNLFLSQTTDSYMTDCILARDSRVRTKRNGRPDSHVYD